MNVMNTEQLLKYLQISKDFGFLSPKEIDEQIEHASELYEMLPIYVGELLDMGAGGGLPSFVFMNMKSKFNFTLLDSMRKRTDFLKSVSEELTKESKFNVINGRAEELALSPEHSGKFDIVVARGFGPPATTAECACNFLKLGGYLFVSGSPENESDRWSDEGLAVLGFTIEEIKNGNYSTGVVIRKTSKHDSKYPRRDGVPRRKPIW